ncbi:ABC transporter ATP-binding protein [Bacillus alkalicellulosilyticus]|uniref:ABC transporter ATP-binding protein n=1 Tax=Alkalihalobacterium alkalicellulosilyticum TaxID=1912214 RepID=UPI00099772C8|nr:ABC transporter ATP-binding protein [Bacillus alkalicellulosilyticus]
MIEVKSLSKVIHNKEVLSDITFQLNPGEIVGLVGRNGAGKTTLLRLLVGILVPTSGDVFINNKSVYVYPQSKRDIMFVPDSSEALKNYSTYEIAAFYKEVYPRFDIVYFEELLERFSLPKTQKIKNYSKGMKALFSLVLAFSTKAKYILLDEPTDGLDVIIKKKILQFIIEEVEQSQVSVIISSHRLDELEFMADKIVMIKDGKLDSDYKLDEIKAAYKKLQVVFTEYIPEVIEKRVTVLAQTGRVYTLLLDNKNEEVAALIEQEKPLLLEELPVGLEDVFVSKLGGEQDVI